MGLWSPFWCCKTGNELLLYIFIACTMTTGIIKEGGGGLSVPVSVLWPTPAHTASLSDCRGGVPALELETEPGELNIRFFSFGGENIFTCVASCSKIKNKHRYSIGIVAVCSWSNTPKCLFLVDTEDKTTSSNSVLPTAFSHYIFSFASIFFRYYQLGFVWKSIFQSEKD